MIDIVSGHTREMIEPVRQLFAEFADGGGADLTSIEFLTELIELPGPYEPPSGRLLVAFEAAHLAGCAGIRDAGEGTCDLGRLYIREEYRGSGVEGRLIAAILRAALEAGYRRIEADLSESMAGAASHLRTAGFDASTESEGCLTYMV